MHAAAVLVTSFLPQLRCFLCADDDTVVRGFVLQSEQNIVASFGRKGEFIFTGNVRGKVWLVFCGMKNGGNCVTFGVD